MAAAIREVILDDIKAAVFDLDGTLVDAFADIAAAVNHGLTILGRPNYSVEEIRRFVGNGLTRLSERALGPEYLDEVQPLVGHIAEYLTLHPADFAQPYPGAEHTLQALRARGIRTGLLTNKRHELSVQLLEKVGLAAHLDAIEGERPGHPHKPDPRPLLAMIERLGAQPASAILVGDGEPDAEAARRAGVRFVGISYGLTPPDRLRELGALRVIDALPQLLSLLNGLALTGQARKPDV